MRLRRMLVLLLCALCLATGALGEDKPSVPAEARYRVDFQSIAAFAPDVAAWLYQPGFINQPVVYRRNSVFYLTHTFSGRTSEQGAIYMSDAEAPDFSGPSIILRGNNNKDYSLFGSLSEYRKPEYYEARPTFYLITPGGEYQLDVFAGIQTRLRGRSDWQVSGSTEEMYENDLPRILEASFLTPRADALPTPQDAWALLVTESNDPADVSRFVIYARMRPMRCETGRVVWMNELEMDQRATYGRVVTAEGVGSWLYYAQNDPTWNRLIFEAEGSAKRRPFGDGGCGPTSIAMILANLVPAEDLSLIADYAVSSDGYAICPCSMDRIWCKGRHLRYTLRTAAQYKRYFPLVVGSFATGNNSLGVKGRYVDGYGTSMDYLHQICGLYGVTATHYELIDVMPLLKQDALAVACTIGYDSPLTNSSHFIVLAGTDEEYLYILDPLYREDYSATDHYDWLEIVTPGLVRIPLKYAQDCGITSIYLLERKK